MEDKVLWAFPNALFFLILITIISFGLFYGVSTIFDIKKIKDNWAEQTASGCEEGWNQENCDRRCRSNHSYVSPKGITVTIYGNPTEGSWFGPCAGGFNKCKCRLPDRGQWNQKFAEVITKRDIVINLERDQNALTRPTPPDIKVQCCVNTLNCGEGANC